MGWEDSLDGFAQAPKLTGGFGSTALPQSSFGGSTWAGGSSFGASSSNWLGSLTKPKAAGWQPAAFPENVGIPLPWSSNAPKPFVSRGDTTGDFIGSLGASFDNALWQNGYLNIANAIPWAEERTFVAAKAMADSVVGDGNPLSTAIDGFAGVLKNVAEPVAKVFQWFPDTVRDTQLNQRASVYKALVKGESVGPLETLLGQILSSVGINSASLTAQGVNAGGLDDKTRQILAGAIDLPDSVKRQIEGNPDGDIGKYFDKAPEGRQFSYAGGWQGAALNLASMGVLYGMEIAVTGGVAGAFRAAAGGAPVLADTASWGARLLGVSADAPLASNLYGVVSSVASGMANAQKLFLAAGISWFGASILTESVLRTMGNKEGVAALDRLNRTTLVSDSPAVQLVSTFTVNPIAGARMALKGELKFLGAPLVALDKATGGKFLKLYDHDTVIQDILAKMYSTNRAGAAEMIGPDRWYENKGEAYDEIVGLAADALVQKLPEAAKNAINALPRPQRTAAMMAQYSKAILDEVAKPAGLVARFRGDWSYHNFYGQFDPAIAKVVSKSYRQAKLITAKAQQELDAVPGYVDFLNPEGQMIVAERIEAAFADGRQGTLQDLNMLSAEHPALNGLVHDLVAKGTNGRPFSKPGDLVPREVFDTALLRATDAYAAARKNPVRMATGSDPVLRPNVHPSEWAAALDTTEETIAALTAATRTPAQDGFIAGFLRQKGLASDAEIAAADPESLFAKAFDYFDRTTEPWVKRGEQVAVIEAKIGEAGTRLAELERRRAAGESIGFGERAAVAEEVGKLQALISDVRDPMVPFSATVKFGESAETQVMANARRKVAAIERVEAIKSVTDEVAPAQVLAVGDLLHSVKQVGGAWTWVADARTASSPASAAAISMFPGWRYRPVLTRGTRKNGAGFMRRTEPAGAQAYHQSPPEYQLAEAIDSPGFLRHLRSTPDKVVDVPEVYGVSPATTVTYGEIADMIAATRVDAGAVVEITPAMIEALGVTTREAFIAKLGSLRDAYDAALDGTTPHALGRTAGLKVPEWAVERAKAGEAASVYRNPTAEAGYGNAVNSLKDALDGQGTFPSVRGIVEGNPLLHAQARELAVAKAQTTGDFLANPANADALRTLVPAVLPDRYVPGVPKPLTPLDEAIMASDPVALADLKIDLASLRGTLAPPLKNVPIEAVNALAAAPRLSRTLTEELNGAAIGWQTLIPEVLWEKSVAGANALGAILSGTFERRPKTIMGLLDSLKQIENGNAANMGVGAQLAAEAQALAESVVRNMIGDARKANLELGVVGMGKNLNPYTWTDDTNRMVQDLFAQEKAANNLLVFRDKTGLQYGLKSAPKGKFNPVSGQVEGGKIAIDMDLVPGLAEELLVGRFQPWQQRVGAVRVNQTFGRLFHLNNQRITYEARGRFEAQMVKYGVPAAAAEKVWSAWRQFAKDTRGEKTKVDKATGEIYSEPASSARYATEKNIENWQLHKIARNTLERFYEERGGLPAGVKAIDFSKEMRLAGSYTRRVLAGGDFRESVAKLPMGDWLERTYGTVAHNEWVTTKYFLFRFGLDARFHAQNKIEGAALDYGRAGLRVAEIDQGMFGMGRKAVATVDELDTMTNTGYPFAVTREARIDRIFKKEQPDAIRGLIKEDPALMRRAMAEIADKDPELADFIAHNGHTTQQYMKIMDAYYGKLMKSADPEAMIEAELARDLIGSPALAEVYGRIYQRNAELLGDLRALMYGNPNRGQIERTLNSFLLYWPISYQIKATKWLLNVMYGKIGGVQTGGLGAYAIDQMQADHERKLVEDPEYGAFFEEHQTLVFAAQMLLPMSPAGMSVGLSPLLRDIFFPETSKGVLSIGPVYTITRFIPGLVGDLYPTFRDVPGADLAYKVTTGWQPPEEKKAKGFTPLP